jgi:hypothetical protein
MTKTPRPDGLIQMIESRKPAVTPADIAKRSGGRITAQRLYSMLSRGELKTFPNRDTIEGLAAGMGVPVAEVVLAAARDLGIEASASDLSGEDDLVIYGGKRLSKDLQAFVMQAADLAREWEATPSDAAPADDRLPDDYDLAADPGDKPSAAEQERARLDERGEEDQSSPDDDDHVA